MFYYPGDNAKQGSGGAAPRSLIVKATVQAFQKISVYGYKTMMPEQTQKPKLSSASTYPGFRK